MANRIWKAGCLGLAMLVPGFAFGAGFQIGEQGTWDMGRALVGSATAADSAATAFYNPAAMTKLDRPNLVLSAMFIDGDSRFDVEPGTSPSFGFGDGGQAVDDVVLPGAPLMVYPISEEWAAGLAVVVPAAGALDYNDDWAGRFIVTEIAFQTIAITPSVAHQVTNELSLGASLIVGYATLDQELRIRNPLMPAMEGQVKIDDADDWAVGFGLSALWEPTDEFRLGVVYRSELDWNDLSGDLDINTAIAGFSFDVDTEILLPQHLNISARYEIHERLALYLDYLWADFSSFELTSIDASNGVGIQLPRNWHDVQAIGVGADFKLTEEWTLSTGYSYAGSPVHRRDRTPDLPIDRQIRFGVGIRYKWSPELELAFSFEHLDLGPAKIANTFALPAGRLKGEYRDNQVQFYALTMSWTF